MPNASPSHDFVYPLTVDPTSRHLVDQTGKPFLLVGDAAWSLIAAASDTDTDLYLANRQQLGFTAILVNLLEHKFSNAPPANSAGVLPFTGKTFTTPNEAYFTHVDTVLQSAAAKGIVVLLDPLYLGFNCGSQGWCAEAKAASASDLTAWGQYIGTRYKNYDNLIWVIGGDTDPSSVQSNLQAMVNGILSVDSRHLITAHNAPEQRAVTPWPGAAWLKINNVYTNSDTLYEQVLSAYFSVPTMPVFLIETTYENEHGVTNQQLRAQSYWTVLSGGGGHVFGNCPIWGFGFTSTFCSLTDWKAELSSQGSLDMQRFQALFNSRSWHTLVPDTQHRVMTSGFGTAGQSDYATAAYASDGSSIIVYMPSARTITLNGSRIAGPSMIGWWVNPSTGSRTKIGTYATSGVQTFTPPGIGDWVLVLDSTNLSFLPPGRK